MPDDLLTKALTKEKRQAINELEALQLLHQAQQENPTFYSAVFPKLYAQHGALSWSLKDDGFKKAIEEFARIFAGQLQAEKERGVAKKPDLDVSVIPTEVLSATNQILNKERFQVKLRKKFVSRLVDSYVKQLRQEQRTAAVVASKGESELRQELTNQLASVVQNAGDERQFSTQALAAISATIDNATAVSTAQALFSSEPILEEIRAVYQEDTVFANFQQAVRQSLVYRCDIEAHILEELITDKPGSPINELKTQAEQKTRLLEALSADQIGEAIHNKKIDQETKAALQTFFQSFSDKGYKKALAPAFDMAVSLMGPERQFAVLQMLTGEAFKKTVGNRRLIEARFGPGSFSTPYFSQLRDGAVQSYKEISSRLSKQLGVRGRIALWLFSGSTAASEAFLDSIDIHRSQKPENRLPGSLGKAIFHLPLGALHTTQAEATSYLLRFWIESRDGIMAILRRNNPSLTHFVLEGGRWVLSWGAGRAGGALLGAARGWAMRAFLRKIIGGALGKAIGGVLGAIGGPLGSLIGSVLGEKILGSLGRRITNLLRFKHTGTRRWHEDPTGLGFALCLVVFPLVIIFSFSYLFSSFINSAFQVTSSRNLAAAGAGAALVGTTSPILGVAGAKITQGPGEDTHSVGGEAVKAYDIGGVAVGTPVYATHDGIVKNIVDRYSPGQHLDTYGNVVVIKSSDGSFETLYAHLLKPADDLIKDQVITKGQLIGYVDDTGTSTGAHLHYEYRGPGDLPPPVL